jgi:hypothetical protein
MQRLRPLSEDECYLRCYGWCGSDDAVRVIRDRPLPDGTELEAPSVFADRVRRALEAQMNLHDAHAA